MAQNNRIAILATGDEITQGDIVNTNSGEIARRLFEHGMTPGTHMTASDVPEEIEIAIRWLLQHHRALIITGGLGPTTDDLTRYALSKATGIELIFFESVWEDIVSRLQYYGYQTPPQSNRQQALFPENATPIPNASGTAAGCWLKHKEQLIFMLPGPPNECLPMIEGTVLPMLERENYRTLKFYKKWLLFGVSEAQIAEELETLTASWQCRTGYRICYPYVEFKIYSNHAADFATLCEKIQNKVASLLTGNGEETASDYLRRTLTQALRITDTATGGLLEHVIKTPKTQGFLQFVGAQESPDIILQGLDEFWQGNNTAKTSVEILFPAFNLPPVQMGIPLRGPRVKQYAVEFFCRETIKILEPVS